MRRANSLHAVMIRKMLALSCAVLLAAGSILIVFTCGVTYRNSLRDAEKSIENAAGQLDMLANSMNNISSMVAYSSVTQNALYTHKQGADGQEKNGLSTLFASTAQYIRLIDNFVLLDSGYSYYTSMFVLSPARRGLVEEFVRGVPLSQKNGRVFWYVPDDGLAGQAVLMRAVYSMDSPSIDSIGYLAITLDMQEIYATAQQYRYQPGSRMMIVDEAGWVLYDETGVRQGEQLPQAVAGQQGCLYTSLGGKAVLAACSGRIGNGWRLVELIDQAAVFRTVWQWAGWSLVVFALAALLFGVVAVLISRSFTAPFAKMKQAMESIEQGDFDIPRLHPVGITEIDGLLRRFEKMARRLNATIEQVYAARIRETELVLSAQQSEIEMLQQQINPHFLYNTLDSIHWMASFGATEEVSRMIIALSDFFRFTVSDYSIVTRVSEEVAFARNYVYLQQRRFGSALTVNFRVDPGAEEYLTLRLLLQPLIENAIVHGTMRGGRPGAVEVAIQVRQGRLELTVEDNGVGMEEATIVQILAAGQGTRSIGLPNILRRLRLVFKQCHTFEIESTPGEGTRIHIAFPALHTEQELWALTQETEPKKEGDDVKNDRNFDDI